MAAQSAIAGMVTLGNGVTVWGQVGISKTLSIGDNAVLLAKSGVGGDLEGNKIYFGAPVEEAGIKEFILVIGYFGDKIRDYIEERYPHLDITFVLSVDCLLNWFNGHFKVLYH